MLRDNIIFVFRNFPRRGHSLRRIFSSQRKVRTSQDRTPHESEGNLLDRKLTASATENIPLMQVSKGAMVE